jgi:hypothetical protein
MTCAKSHRLRAKQLGCVSFPDVAEWVAPLAAELLASDWCVAALMDQASNPIFPSSRSTLYSTIPTAGFRPRLLLSSLLSPQIEW